MTPSPTPHRPTSAPARPGAPSSGAGVSIDPVKLLLKYKWLLVISAGAGAVIGLVSHFVLLRVYPIYSTEVVMECLAPNLDPAAVAAETIDPDEIEKFMGTQVSTIKSELVLDRVVRDARLRTEAPKWTARYIRGGAFNVVDAYEDLEKIVGAGVIPNSYLIRISVSANYKEDAAGIIRLIKQNYLEQLRSVSNGDIVARKDVLRQAIQSANRQLSDLNTRRSRLVRDEGIDTLTEGRSQKAESLRLVNYELIQVQQNIEATAVSLQRDEAQLQRNTAVNYDNTLRLQVDAAPEVLQLKQSINTLEASLAALKSQGIKPGHRDYRILVAQIDGARQQLDVTRERLLRDAFEARVDQSRLVLQQLRAQEADLLKQIEELTSEVTELTRIVGELSDIDRQIETTIELIGKYELDLSELTSRAQLSTATRVRVVQDERVPDVPTFPKIYIMIPLGMILITGLVGGIMVVLELLDQRVKSAADLASIGGMPVLGIIPDSDEDPSQPEHVESVFRDLPGSVLSEHYRQLRTRISKEMVRHGHRTLLVVGALPGSGATSVVSNLGSAMTAAGHTVLLVDANFRRPGLHAAHGANEAPGLADVLAGDSALDEVISRREGMPDLLAAGSPGKRIVEKLGTRTIDEFLTAVRDRYEFVLIDVAPAVVAGDALALANRCDASMLVVRAMNAKRGMVARLRGELSESRAQFLGAMVNGVRSAAGGYMRKNIRASARYATPAGEA